MDVSFDLYVRTLSPQAKALRDLCVELHPNQKIAQVTAFRDVAKAGLKETKAVIESHPHWAGHEDAIF